jgi:WD40 repeat protein
MASPDAARSPWIDREVAWWLANKSPQKLLVVLTEGEFVWDDDAGHADGPTAALPPALRGAFAEEPRWVDLRWLHDVDQVDQSNPRLRECVADVAAAVREVPKDVLVGEHIRQHRRTMRLARGGVTTLVALLVAALVAAVIAVGQRNRAVAAQRTAIGRGMVAQEERIRDHDPRGALQLGVAANKLDPSPLTQASLTQTLLSTPYHGTLTGHTGTLWSVAFSPDGHTLATASTDNTVILWDLTDRNRPQRLGQPLTGHTDTVDSVAFSPDGHTLATASTDHTVILWDLTDRNQPQRLGQPLPGQTNTGRAVAVSLAFSPDGHTLATSAPDLGSTTPNPDQTVILWDLTDRNQPHRLGQPFSTGQLVRSVAFSRDGRTLATGGEKTVILWLLGGDPAKPIRLGEPLTGHTDLVNSVAFSPDGHTLAAASTDKTVILWALDDIGNPLPRGQSLIGHTDTVISVAFAPDGRTLATASWDRTAILWDLSGQDRPQRLAGPLTDYSPSPTHFDFGHMVNTAALSPDGRTLAIGHIGGTVFLWDLAGDQPLQLNQPLIGHTQPVNDIAFAPDSRTLATASADHTVILWDLTDRWQPRRLGQPLTGHTEAVTMVSFSPDGRTLATVGDEKVILWDLTDRYQPRRLGQPLTIGHLVSSVAFSPDKRTVAVANGDGTAILWDLTDRKHPHQIGQPLTGNTNPMRLVAFSPDGHTLVTATVGDTAILWNLTDRNQPRRVGRLPIGPADEVDAVAFSSDGHTLATTNVGDAILWDLTNRDEPRQLGQPLLTSATLSGISLPSAVQFSPDGHTLVTVDMAVILWDLTSLEKLRRNAVQEACTRAGGPLDMATWDFYAPGISYQDTCASP